MKKNLPGTIDGKASYIKKGAGLEFGKGARRSRIRHGDVGETERKKGGGGGGRGKESV